MQRPSDERSPAAPDLALTPDELRARLVDSLWKNGVLTSTVVDAAMRAVPRHRFLPGTPIERAYADEAVPTHWEGDVAVSSASQPAIVALMLQQLELEPGMHVLEVGAGTGYNAALMAERSGPFGSVTTLDVDPVVAAEAREHLHAAGYPSVQVHTTDGRAGWPPGAPYDRIILTVGTDDLAPAWVDQLAEGGLLLLPLRLGGTPTMPVGGTQASVAFRKHGDTLTSESVVSCGFMPLRGTQARPEVAALAKDRLLQAGHAAELRETVATLLATRARVRFVRRADPDIFQYLGLLGARIVAVFPRSQDARPRRVRYGIYAEDADGPSLAIFSVTLPLGFIFGSDAAERLIERAASNSPASLPSVEQWNIAAHLRPAGDAVPEPPGALRITRPNTVFDVWLGDKPAGYASIL